MAKKAKVYQPPVVIKRASLVLYHSNGEGFSKPASYRGYYLSYQEISPEGGIGAGVCQRILPKISEKTEENDKLAIAKVEEMEREIEAVFNRFLEEEKVKP